MRTSIDAPRRATTPIVLGVGVVVTRDGKVPLGRRRAPFPCWSLPGGKLEPFETVEHCARRELMEETGLAAGGKPLTLCASNIRLPGLHTVTFGVHFPGCFGELRLAEPDKFSAWDWFDLDRLPKDLFVPARIVLERFVNRTAMDPAACAFDEVAA